MSQQIISTGTGPNTGTGDPGFTAFTKVNANFTELYAGTAPLVGPVVIGAPPSGVALTVNGAPNTSSLVINNPAQGSPVSGVVINATGVSGAAYDFEIKANVNQSIVVGFDNLSAGNVAGVALFLNTNVGGAYFEQAGGGFTGSVIPNAPAGQATLLGNFGNVPLVFGTNHTTAMIISGAQNISTVPPTSGASLTVNGLPAAGLTAIYNNGAAQVILFQGTGPGNNGFGTNSAHDFTIVSGGTNRTTWSTAGNVSMAASTGGSTLTVAAGTLDGVVITSNHTSGSGLGFSDTNASPHSYRIGLGIGDATTSLNFYDATAAAIRMALSAAGGFSINAPSSSAQALAVNGVSGSNTLFVNAPNAAGNSFGLVIQAGTNASDYAFRVLNSPGGLEFMRIYGNGAISFNGAGGTTAITGWGTSTGGAVVTNFPGATATLVQATTVIAQMITYFKNLGLFGA